MAHERQRAARPGEAGEGIDKRRLDAGFAVLGGRGRVTNREDGKVVLEIRAGVAVLGVRDRRDDLGGGGREGGMQVRAGRVGRGGARRSFTSGGGDREEGEGGGKEQPPRRGSSVVRPSYGVPP